MGDNPYLMNLWFPVWVGPNVINLRRRTIATLKVPLSQRPPARRAYASERGFRGIFKMIQEIPPACAAVAAPSRRRPDPLFQKGEVLA
jgi:hypothetical protein